MKNLINPSTMTDVELSAHLTDQWARMAQLESVFPTNAINQAQRKQLLVDMGPYAEELYRRGK